MIHSVDLQNLRNADYLQFQKDFLAIISRNNPSVLEVQTKYDELTQKADELENLFKKVLAHPISKELLALDQRRDDCINGIYYTALGNTYHFDMAKREAADVLLARLKLYGSGIAKLNYQSETATINNIINDWEDSPALNQAIITLSLSAWKEELNLINGEFNAKYLNRTQDYGAANPKTFKLKREETNVIYYALRDRINALHLLVETSSSPYKTVIYQLNALIDQYNLLTTIPTNPVENPNP